MHRERAGAFEAEAGEPTAAVRERVRVAREAAALRWKAHGVRTNAEVSGVLLRRHFRLDSKTMEPLKKALDRGVLSIRGVDRTLRVAWTLADLGGRTAPGLVDVTTALSFRDPGGVQ
jgi:magnesium chelatase family protein